MDSITSADEFIRPTRRPAEAIVLYLNELSNVFSLNTACGENYTTPCAETHFATVAVNINEKIVLSRLRFSSKRENVANSLSLH